MRLSAREWLITVALAAAAFIAIPRIWEKHEAWTMGPDYRIPVALSNDYWLFQPPVSSVSRRMAIFRSLATPSSGANMYSRTEPFRIS